MEHQVVSREFLFNNLTNPIDSITKQKCWNYVIKQLINVKNPLLQKEDLIPFLTTETSSERENAILREAEHVTAENLDAFLAVNRKYNGRNPLKATLYAFECATDIEVQITLSEKLLHRTCDLEQQIIIALLNKGNQYFFDKAINRIRYKPVFTNYLGDIWKAFADLPLTEIQQEQFLHKAVSGSKQNFADIINLVNSLNLPYEGILNLGISHFSSACNWDIEDIIAIVDLISKKEVSPDYRLAKIRRLFLSLGSLTQKEEALKPLCALYIAEIKERELYIDALNMLRKTAPNPQSRGIFLEIANAILKPIIAARNKEMLSNLYQIVMASINSNIRYQRVRGLLEFGKTMTLLTANYNLEPMYQGYGCEIIKETAKKTIIGPEHLNAALGFIEENPYYLANIIKHFDWKKTMLNKEVLASIKRVYPYNPKETISCIENLLSSSWIDCSLRFFIEQNLLEPLKIHTIKTELPYMVTKSAKEIRQRQQIQKFLDE